ncbi:MAG: hypothetical protein M0P26_07640 [Bacteroidales bacterium]|nr:hypothetical protein [Bacteroidales bacterium]
MSFIANCVLFDGLTFDDMLASVYLKILPKEVNLFNSFTRHIRLNTPFIIEKTKFTCIINAGKTESHPYDEIMTSEVLNDSCGD